MSEPERSASSTSPDPFGEANGPPDDLPDPSSFTERPGQELSLAWDMARMWTREHQEAAMLGAFAVGVFAGAWLRD